MAAHPPRNDPNQGNKDETLTAICHCGRIRVTLLSKPTFFYECHCTVCYKYGGIFAPMPRKDVVVTVATDTMLQPYTRSDIAVCLSFQRCGYCGCVVFWLGEGEYTDRAGVNCRMLNESEIEGIERRIIQGPKEDLYQGRGGYYDDGTVRV